MAFAAKMTVLGRASHRRSVMLPATIRNGPDAFDVTIQDLSSTGFRTSLAIKLDPGDKVTIGTASLGVLNAHVVWADANDYGFALQAHLSQQLIEGAADIDNVLALPGAQVLDQFHGVTAEYPSDSEKWSRQLRLLILVVGVAVSWLAAYYVVSVLLV